MKRARSSFSKGPSATAAKPEKQKHSKQKTESSSSSSSPSRAKTSPASAVASLAVPCRSALLVVGNYHAVMAGLVLKKEKFYLKFAIKHHVGNVNDVAVTDRYVASCGADERVFLFTNKADQKLNAAQRARMQAAGEPLAVRLADLGSLTPPCEVVCLTLTSNSQYLLCGCADGQLLVYRTRDWTLSNSLPVHEKALVSIGLHPGSAGTLVVTVGADRSVAVLDLAKGRLLTKWKYNPHSSPAGHEAKEEEEEEETPDEEESEEEEKSAAEKSEKVAKTSEQSESETKANARKTKEAPAHPLQRLFAREEPIKVVFSPLGSRFLVLARFSLVVYATSTMEPVKAVRLPQPPQPLEEIHSIAFLDEETVLLGNEAAQLLVCHMGSEAPVPAIIAYPADLKTDADGLLATRIRADRETREKNPLRHVSRIKAIHRVGRTVFTLDSNGLVFNWTLVMPKTAAGSVTLTYVTSANCQGRATSLDVLPL